jgi:hypothetical protein
MWKDTIDNDDSPTVTKDWKNKVEYWERILDALYEIYNDHTIEEGIDSSSKYFWPKTKKILNANRNGLHVISSIMDGDFDNVKYGPVYVGPK